MNNGVVNLDKDIFLLAQKLQRQKNKQEKQRQRAAKYPDRPSPVPKGSQQNLYEQYKAMVEHERSRKQKEEARKQWYFNQGRIYQAQRQYQKAMIQQNFMIQAAQALQTIQPFPPTFPPNFISYPSNNFQTPSSSQLYPQMPFTSQLGGNPQPLTGTNFNVYPPSNSMIPPSSLDANPEAPVSNPLEEEPAVRKQGEPDCFNTNSEAEQLLTDMEQDPESDAEDDSGYSKSPVAEAVTPQPLENREETFQGNDEPNKCASFTVCDFL